MLWKQQKIAWITWITLILHTLTTIYYYFVERARSLFSHFTFFRVVLFFRLFLYLLCKEVLQFANWHHFAYNFQWSCQYMVWIQRKCISNYRHGVASQRHTKITMPKRNTYSTHTHLVCLSLCLSLFLSFEYDGFVFDCSPLLQSLWETRKWKDNADPCHFKLRVQIQTQCNKIIHSLSFGICTLFFHYFDM